MNKENIFIKSVEYHNLLKKAQQLIPEQKVIMNELYNKVFKDDIEHCFKIHFGKSNKVEVYLYQNYYDTLTFAFVLNHKCSKDFLTNVETYIENVVEMYEDIELFGNRVEDHEIIQHIADLRGVNGLLLKLK